MVEEALQQETPETEAASPKEILDELNARKAIGQAPADIELYYPAMAQGQAAEPIDRYCDNGNTEPGELDDGSIGYTHLQQSIEDYGRFTWHDYFFSWHAFEGCVSNYFPDWLKNDLYGAPAFPSRITECGWWHDDREHRVDRDTSAGVYDQYDCFDLNPAPASEGIYRDALVYLITQSRVGGLPPAGGAAVWLLSSPDPQFARHVAVDQSGVQKAWYQSQSFKLWQP